MSPKEKAIDLLSNMVESLSESNGTGSGAINVAIIAVDEILDEIGLPVNEYDVERLEYWQEVKNQLNQM